MTKVLVRIISYISLFAVVLLPVQNVIAIDQPTYDMYSENDILFYQEEEELCVDTNNGLCSELSVRRNAMWSEASENDKLRFMNVVATENYGIAAVEAYMNQVISKYGEGKGNNGTLNSWLGGQCVAFMHNGASKCAKAKSEMTSQDQQLINLALSGSNYVKYASGNATGGSTVGAGKIVCIWKSDNTREGLGYCRDDVDLSKQDGKGVCNVYSESSGFGECWGYEQNEAWATEMQSLCGVSNRTASSNDPLAVIWSYLRNDFGLNLTDEMVAGIMGNMYTESHLLPTMIEGGKKWSLADIMNSESRKAYGLIQWDSGRRLTLLNKMKDQKSNLMKYIDKEYSGYSLGYNVNSGQYTMPTGMPEADFFELLNFQLEHLRWELNDNGGYEADQFKKFMAAGDGLSGETAVARFAWAFNKYVERSDTANNDENNLATRTGPAKHFYGLLKGTSVGCESNNGTSLAEVAISLAWPDRSHNNPFDPKPEYVEARKKLGTVGGCPPSSAGADCSNFISTAILLWGGDPEYKHNRYTGNMLPYYQKLAADPNSNVIEIENLGNTSNLEPGDIFVVTKSQTGTAYGHTMMYIGDLGAKYGGKASWDNVSASCSSRVPDYARSIYFKTGAGKYSIFRYTSYRGASS